MTTLGITLSGADEHTDMEALIALADQGAEIALLYTFSPDGRKRYPPLSWIQDAALVLKGRAALHVCGPRARATLGRGHLHWLLKLVARVQINGNLSREDVALFCAVLAPRTVITQHSDGSASVLDAPCYNHALLVDASAGRGLQPREWTRPRTEKAVGFAGGLGPETLQQELPRIAAIAQQGSWIDMESRLRDKQDWFNIQKAQACVDIWREFVKKGGCT